MEHDDLAGDATDDDLTLFLQCEQHQVESFSFASDSDI